MPLNSPWSGWNGNTWNQSVPLTAGVGRVIVRYDGQGIIPGPFIRLQRKVVRSPDGTLRQRGWQGELSGTLLAFAGSPLPDGTFHTGDDYPADPPYPDHDEHLAVLIRKKAALAKLFGEDGKWFEIVAADDNTWGRTVLKFQPRWGQIAFDEGRWFHDIRWTAPFECDFIQPSDDGSWADQDKNQPEESWNLEPTDETARQYKLTHTVTATGTNRYSEDGSGAVVAHGWEVARDLIIAGPLAGFAAQFKLGMDTSQLRAPGVANLFGFAGFNYRRSVQVDKPAGKYAVVETWDCINPDAPGPSGLTGGACLEDFSVETRHDGPDGLTSVTVSGVIRGMEGRNNTTFGLISSKHDNMAQRAAGVTTAWLHGVSQAETGITLNPIPVTQVASRNKVEGVLTYSATFNTRVGPTIPGVLSESLLIEYNNSCDAVVRHTIPFRVPGPLLQGLATVTEKTVTLRAEIRVQTGYGLPTPSPPAFNPVPYLLAALPGVPSQFYIVSDTPTWSPTSGQYTHTTTALYQ